MKKLILPLLIISLLFNAGILVGWARRGLCGRKERPRITKPLLGGPRGLDERRVDRLVKALNLSPEQTTELKGLALRFQKERGELFKTFTVSKQALNTAVFTAQPDPKAVEAALGLSPMPKLQQLMVTERLAVNALLTPEQRTTLMSLEKTATEAWAKRKQEKPGEKHGGKHDKNQGGRHP